MAYPTALDSFQVPQGTALLADANFDHALSHRSQGSAIIAVETKLGLSAGSPVVNAVLSGSGNGTSVWGTTLSSIRVNNSTFGTPSVTGGTLNNVVLGTPSITGGTASFDVLNITGAGTLNGYTFGTPVINVWNGWINANETWTVAGTAAQSGTLGLAATGTAKYDVGDKVRFNQGTALLQMYVTGVSGTIINVTAGTTYVLGTAAITTPQYSKSATPQGFPHHFGYTTTITGVSTPTTDTNFTIIGRTLYLSALSAIGGSSTSNALTFTIPVATSETNTSAGIVNVLDNSSPVTTPGNIQTTASSNIVTVYKSFFQTTWTATGNKNIYFSNLAFSI